jgi:hypothetical protein
MNAWGSDSNKATIVVDGTRLTVDAGTDFRTKVNEVARQYGLGKIRVLLDGDELYNENDAPATIPAGCLIEIRRDDRAGH